MPDNMEKGDGGGGEQNSRKCQENIIPLRLTFSLLSCLNVAPDVFICPPLVPPSMKVKRANDSA